jgi:cytochrome c-type biogenesis protein CcmF
MVRHEGQPEAFRWFSSTRSFGLFLAGILISSSKKEVLSYNTSGIPVFFGNESKESPGENLTLIKGMRTDMGKYWVTYEKDSAHPKKPLWFYQVQFEAKNRKRSIYPNAKCIC